MTQKLNMQEEKIVNLSRLVKLLQSYSDAQEDDCQNIKRRIHGLEDQVHQLRYTGRHQEHNTLQQNQEAFNDLLSRSRSNERDVRSSPVRAQTHFGGGIPTYERQADR